MVRKLFNPHSSLLPRARQQRPEGLGTAFLWTRKGDWSRSESLAKLLMPKEWNRVEELRKVRRERILREREDRDGGQANTPAPGSGLAAGEAVAAAVDGAEAVSAEDERAATDDPGEGNERGDVGGSTENGGEDGRPDTGPGDGGENDDGEANESHGHEGSDGNGDGEGGAPNGGTQDESTNIASHGEGAAHTSEEGGGPTGAEEAARNDSVRDEGNNDQPNQDSSPEHSHAATENTTDIAAGLANVRVHHVSTPAVTAPEQFSALQPWFQPPQQTWQWPMPNAPVSVYHAHANPLDPTTTIPHYGYHCTQSMGISDNGGYDNWHWHHYSTCSEAFPHFYCKYQ